MRLIQFVLLAAICLAASANREIQPGASPAIMNFKLGSPSILLDLLVDKSDFGESKFLVVIIETLTPGVDVHIKDATSISVSLIECTGSSTNVCLITRETIREFSQQSGTFSLSASCASDCLFSVKSAYENRNNLGMNSEKILVKSETEDMKFQVDITPDATQSSVETFLLEIELMNPAEVKHYFTMRVFAQDGELLFQKDQLGNAQEKGFFQLQGKDVFSHSTLSVEIETRKSSILRVISQSLSKFRQIQPFRAYSEKIMADSEKVFYLDAASLVIAAAGEPINGQFQLVTTSGSCVLSVDTNLSQPSSVKKYLNQSENSSSEQGIRLDFDEFGAANTFWIGVRSGPTRQCVFLLQVSFAVGSNSIQQLELNFPISGVATAGKVEAFHLTVPGSITESLKVILNTDSPSTALLLKPCKLNSISCEFTENELSGIDTTGIQRTTALKAHSKVLNINIASEQCVQYKIDSQSYCLPPSHSYSVGIFSKTENTAYFIQAVSLQIINNLVESTAFFDELSELETITYRFHLAEEKAKALKFTTVAQYGEIEAKLFLESKSALADGELESAEPIQTSQWGILEVFEPAAGFYFVQVFAKSNAKYGVIAHVIRSAETAQKSEIQKLTFDMPHKVSLADGKQESVFSVHIAKIADVSPDVWISLKALSNNFDVYITHDESVLARDNLELYNWRFKNPKQEMYLNGTQLASSKIFIKVVPLQASSSQIFVIKLRSAFSFAPLVISKPSGQVHIHPHSAALFKIPVDDSQGLVITKNALTCKGRTLRIQIDFESEIVASNKFYEEYFNDIVSIPAEVISSGCSSQQLPVCFLFVRVISENEECMFQLLVNNEETDGIIEAYDGYSNKIRSPVKASDPVKVDYFITNEESIIIRVFDSPGLAICARIVNQRSATNTRDLNNDNCYFRAASQMYENSQQLKVHTEEIQQFCRFADSVSVCVLQVNVFSEEPSRFFRLSILQGITPLAKGKLAFGHAENQSMELFEYTSVSEFPLNIHLTSLDSSELDLFVVFGEDRVPIAFKEFDWSLQDQNLDEHVLRIGIPIEIQKGSLKGVYVIGVYSKFGFGRFQVLVTQERTQVLELLDGSHHTLKLDAGQSQFFEFTPKSGDTEFKIKLLTEYGTPKIAIKSAIPEGNSLNAYLPDIQNGNYTVSNILETQSDSLSIPVNDDSGKTVYLVELWSSLQQPCSFTMITLSSSNLHMLHNKPYHFRFNDTHTSQSLTYSAKGYGSIIISVDYGTVVVELESSHAGNSQRIPVVDFQTSIQYAPNENIALTISGETTSFSVIAIGPLEQTTYHLGEIRSILATKDQPYFLKFSYNPLKNQQTIQLNVIIENDEVTPILFIPSFRLHTIVNFIVNKYGQQKTLPVTQKKLDHSWIFEFPAFQGEYILSITYPKWQYIENSVPALKLKVYITTEKVAILGPNSRLAGRVHPNETYSIIQRKTNHQAIEDSEQKISIAVTVCSGRLDTASATPFIQSSTTNETSSNNSTMDFLQISRNIYILEESSPEIELSVNLRGALQEEETQFNYESQLVPRNDVSIYKKIFISDPKLAFNQNQGHVLFFEGVHIYDAFYEKDVFPLIDYEIYLLKISEGVSNTLCPDFSRFKNQSNSNSTTDNKIAEVAKAGVNQEITGYHLGSYQSHLFNVKELFVIQDLSPFSQENQGFYFVVEAKVQYKSQTAYLLYNSGSFYEFPVAFEKEVPFYQNVFLMIAIGVAATAVITMVIVVRQKIKYLRLVEEQEMQEQHPIPDESTMQKKDNSVVIENVSVDTKAGH